MKELFLWICAAPFFIGFGIMLLTGIWSCIASFSKTKVEIL